MVLPSLPGFPWLPSSGRHEGFQNVHSLISRYLDCQTFRVWYSICQGINLRERGYDAIDGPGLSFPQRGADMTEDKEKLFDDVGIELGELRRTADRLDEAVATQFGLNRTDLRCIGILYRRGRVTAGELAEESGLTPGAITTVLDRMERDGYANRVADPSDRRRVMVTSTTATRELGARVYGEVELAGRAQLEKIEPAGVAVIRDYLRGIREFYEELVSGIASPPPSPDVASAAAPQNGRFTAPLDGVSLGRLEFIKGAAKARIGVDASLTGLYRGEFKGSVPDIN